MIVYSFSNVEESPITKMPFINLNSNQWPLIQRFNTGNPKMPVAAVIKILR
jgi:hypothetical protein